MHTEHGTVWVSVYCVDRQWKLMELNRKVFDVYDGQVLVGRRAQYPFRLAYAMTMNRCQGQTLRPVEVHAENLFAPGQLYVACSRATTAAGLLVTGLVKVKANIVDKDAVAWFKRHAEMAAPSSPSPPSTAPASTVAKH